MSGQLLQLSNRLGLRTLRHLEFLPMTAFCESGGFLSGDGLPAMACNSPTTATDGRDCNRRLRSDKLRGVAATMLKSLNRSGSADDDACIRFGDPGRIDRAFAPRQAHIDPSQEQITFSRGGNEKPDLYAVASCIKVRPCGGLPRYRTATKDIQILWTGFASRSGSDPEAATSQS